MFSYVDCLSILTDSGSRPYDVSNDVMKFSISEITNDDISETGRPIDFMFDPRVGFSGTADRMDLLPVGPNPRWRTTYDSNTPLALRASRGKKIANHHTFKNIKTLSYQQIINKYEV